MASSHDRFYQLKLSDRDAKWGDIGSSIRILGLVVGGNGSDAILLLPSAKDSAYAEEANILSTEEWSEFIQRSDDPEILIGEPKVFQRKLRYQISGAVQQKVWAADGCKCMYCGAEMGKANMTIDHFVPLELGGENNESNYLTSCAKCNKKKGNMSAEEWCKKINHPTCYFVEYLENRKLP